MAPWAPSILSCKQPIMSLLPAALSTNSTPSCSYCRMACCYLKPSTPLLHKGSSISAFNPQINGICSKELMAAKVVDSKRTSFVGVWEEPDDGSESDDENEFDEENDLDFESDWEESEEEEVEEVKSSSNAILDDEPASINYEDQLAKEVEQLLEPEELVIWQQNAAPNIEKISTAKWSPLHTLALSGQIHYLDRLLENGVHIDTPDKDGLTALHISVIGKKEAVISHLLRKGANPHVKDKDGVTPLHYAVQVGAMQTVKLLIKYNVDVNSSDDEGWTPLHVAMQSRNRDIAKVLLLTGADKTRKNKDGKTPLDLSFAYGKDFKSYDLAKLLMIVPANRDL